MCERVCACVYIGWGGQGYVYTNMDEYVCVCICACACMRVCVCRGLELRSLYSTLDTLLPEPSPRSWMISQVQVPTLCNSDCWIGAEILVLNRLPVYSEALSHHEVTTSLRPPGNPQLLYRLDFSFSF